MAINGSLFQPDGGLDGAVLSGEKPVARSLSIVNTFAVFGCPDMNSYATLPVVVAVPVD